MSTLYIRLPSRAAVGDAAGLLASPCPYALTSHGKTVEQHGLAALPQLSGAIEQAQRIVLLLAAADVTLLHVKVPPLSAAKLKAALPNLVEDRLIGDPADCTIVASSSTGGLRTVAVVQRNWLQLLSDTLSGYGARQVAALPAQLCLPCQSGGAFAALDERQDGIDVTLRLSEHSAIGWAAHGTSARETLAALRAGAPDTQLTLYVPQNSVSAWRNEADSTAPDSRIVILADEWPRWIAGANGAAPDLMGGLGKERKTQTDWRAWRWPLALAAAVLLVNLVALNLDWWRMKREAAALRATMVQTYRAAYPQESVIIDPVAQMQQKIALAKRSSGQAAPDDFTALLAIFAEAWNGSAGQPGAIAGLEYRNRALFVRFKLGGETPEQAIKAALAARNLSLEASSQGGAALWKIMSAK